MRCAGREYILLARLVTLYPPVVLKPKEVDEGDDEAEGEGGGQAAEGEDANGEEEGEQGSPEVAAAGKPPPEMVPVTNTIEEPGEEPFWTLRVFSTVEISEELIKVNTDKYDAIDAFVGECRESEGREAFNEKLAQEAAAKEAAAAAAAAAAGPVSAEPSEEAPPSEAEPEGGAGEEGEEQEPWPPLKVRVRNYL